MAAGSAVLSGTPHHHQRGGPQLWLDVGDVELANRRGAVLVEFSCGVALIHATRLHIRACTPAARRDGVARAGGTFYLSRFSWSADSSILTYSPNPPRPARARLSSAWAQFIWMCVNAFLFVFTFNV